MKKAISAIIMLLLLLSVIGYAEQTQTNYISFAGDDQFTPFYPDANSIYHVYAFKQEDFFDTNALKLTGTFADAQYFSLNFYAGLTPQAAIKDTDIIPDVDAIGHDGEIIPGQSTYTIYIAKEGANIDAQNLLYFNEDVDLAILIIRFYMPTPKWDGNVNLLTLSAVDIETLQPSSLPDNDTFLIDLVSAFSYLLVSDRINTVHDNLNTGQKILSYKLAIADNAFSDADNEYLLIPIHINEDVAYFKFKPPTVSDAYNDDRDMRYWSLGFGDSFGVTYFTLDYTQMKSANDGYIHVAIGTKKTLETVTKFDGVHYIEWPKNEELLVIYRNLLTNEGYENSLVDIEEMSLDNIDAQNSADLYIGEYAPSGEFISVWDFNEMFKDFVVTDDYFYRQYEDKGLNFIDRILNFIN